MTDFQPGVYTMPEAAYFADPLRGFGTESLSRSGATFLLPPYTPAHFRFAQDHQHSRQSDALMEGKALHSLVFGGQPVIDIGTDALRGAHATEVRALRDEGNICVKSPVYATVKELADAVHADPIADIILADGQPEQSVFAVDPDTGVWIRGRFDWMCRPDPASDTLLIVDLKSSLTAYPSADAFGKQVFTYGYHRQGAWYLRLARILGLAQDIRFLLLVVEKNSPHLVNVMEIPLIDLKRADRVNAAAMRLFARCLDAGEWPGYSKDLAVMPTVPLPSWAELRDENLVNESEEF
ncbi:MAG: PD-(D/E)XK nuclease-like domain-containing protein [Propionibacteriaceae bacterium]|nr:PD-(D/E)XK nuclease-like domain-containing protein [Propionibacteriaceae bacterium]